VVPVCVFPLVEPSGRNPWLGAACGCPAVSLARPPTRPQCLRFVVWAFFLGECAGVGAFSFCASTWSRLCWLSPPLFGLLSTFVSKGRLAGRRNGIHTSLAW
jgi:hypothetical protein